MIRNSNAITRPNGAITTMTYDAKNNLLTSTEQAISGTTSFLWQKGGPAEVAPTE